MSDFNKNEKNGIYYKKKVQSCIFVTPYFLSFVIN